MKKTKEISSFFYSQYFAEGVRITLGAIIPVVVCAVMGEFVTGTLISLGALIVGLSDTPGAPRHRKFGILYCTILCVFTIIITALVNNSVALMTIVIAVLAFLYAMLAVFNARAATIGTMCILIMLINVDDVYSLKDELIYLLYFIIGAGWYTLISLSFMKVRPYRLAQQELSETIVHVADYLRLKAHFYDTEKNIDNTYLKLIEKQILINEHQENVRDFLFQSKRSIKDTTKEGRYLTLVFNDIVDLFEQSMTTHYDYSSIRNDFDETGLLTKMKGVILKITHELDNIGYKLNANRIPHPIYNLEKEIELLRIAVDEYSETSNINMIPLRKIIINIRTISRHIQDIYKYSKTNSLEIKKAELEHTKKFINTDVLNWQSFKDNLSFDSSIFRHALRMSIVLSGTYLFFNLIDYNSFGTYWILLTILVILKPGFGLTKERNLQRLIGTIIGGIIGGIILMTIPDLMLRFAILIIFFLIAYSLFRINYIMAVIFMTPYVLIMLSFTGVNTIDMAQERVIDTFLGGTIAFLSSYIIFPNWESFQIKSNMRLLLIANYQYLTQAMHLISGKPLEITEYKLARKEVYIASANMGSTFQRLITEPKWRQKVSKEVNRFVILNHIFSSYTATLLTQLNESENTYFKNEHLRLIDKSLNLLADTIDSLEIKNQKNVSLNKVSGIEKIEIESSDSDETKLITDQLQFLLKIATDLNKISSDYLLKSELEEKLKKNESRI